MRLAALASGAAMLLPVGVALAQLDVPAAAPPDGATLFKRQCATCHSLAASEPMRQGPPLAGVIGRRAGSVEAFHYSAGFQKADWSWDEAHLDQWLTNPQAMVPGTIMAYRQANAATRRTIISYLKDAQ